MKIDKVREIIGVTKDLLKYSKQLTRLDVKSCNVGLTDRDDEKVKKIELECEALASKIGLKAYHQCDPRGCSLYLIDNTMNDTNYNRGIAIY